MPIEYLKKANPPVQSIDTATAETVRRMLAEIEAGGDETVRRYARDLDGWRGEIVVSETDFAKAEAALSTGVKDDIRFARDRVQEFAQRQRDSLHEFQAELIPGLLTRQRLIPCNTAGCYVPGGRCAHAASAIMSVGTAAVAGVRNIVATSPAHKEAGINPAILYAMKLFGAHTVLALGGVQAVAALAYGRFTTSRTLGQQALAPAYIDSLPDLARAAASAAWRDYAEIVLCADRDEVVEVSDRYASEHLQVMARDLDWWLASLSNYGSLFLGEETTVAYGDKCSGPNHILPTRGAARYSGGLSVGKFIKTVTWQRLTRQASRMVGQVAARISRLEGMEGHARTGDIRLHKYFPQEQFELGTLAGNQR